MLQNIHGKAILHVRMGFFSKYDIVYVVCLYFDLQVGCLATRILDTQDTRILDTQDTRILDTQDTRITPTKKYYAISMLM